MNALERKVLRLIEEHRNKYGEYPKYVNALIRWNDDKEYVRNTIFALFEYDGSDDNERVFYYTDTIGVLQMCANLDFTMDDFDCPNDFYDEVDKYDTDEPTDLDYHYLHRGEDFCIVDVNGVFSSLD